MTAAKELQNYTFTAKYARWLPDKKRRETWTEAVNRVKNMMLVKYKDCGIDNDIEWAYDFMQKKKVLGSQRVLQFGGDPIFKHNARCYNCCGNFIDRLKAFQDSMYLLLCGCGVGFSLQKHHVEKLPDFTPNRNFVSTEKPKIYVIPDNIEGWADSIGVLLSSYFENPVFEEYYDSMIEFNYSKIRPKGAYLNSSAGKAPGPEPLKKCHKKIKEVLDKCIKNNQKRLRPIDAHDILCHIADGVISGGVRRSACISLFSKDDKEMMTCKTGNWFTENPQRGRANNSVILLKDDTTFKEFQDIFQITKEFGEPGIAWVDSLNIVLNPCAEISFYCYDDNGQSGTQFCNLCTMNCGNVDTEEDFLERCKAAAIIGTLQAGFTDFPYLGKVSEDITKRESLLGVSMSGMMQKTDLTFSSVLQKKGAKLIRKVNKEIAAKIGINPASRTTCIKPDGQSSCLLSTSSGIHPHHAKRYLRRVQNNKQEVVYQYFKNTNPKHVEESVWSANDSDENIIFPIEVPDGSKTKNMVSALEMLEMVKNTQQNWVLHGKNEDLCPQKWLTHNISNTVVVQEDEWDDVIKYVFKNRKYLCGISFLPASGDKDYPQAPYTTVYTSREIVREYGEAAIWCSGLIELGLQAFDNNLWKACDFAIKCDTDDAINHLGLKKYSPEKIKEMQEDFSVAGLKLNFLVKMKKFARNYFDGNVKRLTYCMKDVFNWKMYLDLEASIQPVDYSQMYEDSDNTKFEGDASCAGGACLI